MRPFNNYTLFAPLPAVRGREDLIPAAESRDIGPSLHLLTSRRHMPSSDFDQREVFFLRVIRSV